MSPEVRRARVALAALLTLASLLALAAACGARSELDLFSGPPEILSECPYGFADCDGDPANGCEADIETSNDHCGACGAACAPDLFCGLSACRRGTEVIDVAISDSGSACAALARGDVWCWGANEELQLGQRTRGVSLEPLRVPGVEDVVRLSAAVWEVCATLRDRTGVCWGNGELPHATPPLADVALFESLAQRARCALTTRGEVHCWGRNDVGQLGDGTFADSDQPVRVQGLADVIELRDQCALDRVGEVHCWGKRPSAPDLPFVPGYVNTGFAQPLRLGQPLAHFTNGYGGIGGLAPDGELLWEGGATKPLLPVQGTEEGVAIASSGLGRDDAILLDRRGVATSIDGFAGHAERFGGPAVEYLMVVALSVDDAVAVRAGGYSACAIRGHGRVTCWGSNFNGQLGGGYLTPFPSPSEGPVDVQGLPEE